MRRFVFLALAALSFGSAAVVFACGKSLDDDDDNPPPAPPTKDASSLPDAEVDGSLIDSAPTTDALADAAATPFCDGQSNLFCSDFGVAPATTNWPTSFENPLVLGDISTTSDSRSAPFAADFSGEVVDGGGVVAEVALLKTSQLSIPPSSGVELTFALKAFATSKPPYVIAKLDYFDSLGGPVVAAEYLFVTVNGKLALFVEEFPVNPLDLLEVNSVLPLDKYANVRIHTPLSSVRPVTVTVDDTTATRGTTAGAVHTFHPLVTLTVGLNYNNQTTGPARIRLDDVMVRAVAP